MTLKPFLQTDISLLRSYEPNPTNPNLVVGPLYFQFDEFAFPSLGWMDRVLSVLSWWVYPLRELLLGQTSTAELGFGEGAVGVIVTRVNAATIELRFVCDLSGTTEERHRRMLPIADFLTELERVSGELEIYLHQSGWSHLSANTADFKRLRLLLSR